MRETIDCRTNAEVRQVMTTIQEHYATVRWGSGHRPTEWGMDFDGVRILLDLEKRELLIDHMGYDPETKYMTAWEFLRREATMSRSYTTFACDTHTTSAYYIPFGGIEKVIYNPPATIVFFATGEKIVSKTEDKFDWEVGLAICLLKRAMTSKQYNRMQPYLFAEEPKAKHGKVKWVPLWDVMVRQAYPNGEWEKIKKEWKMK